jgi:CheY-like chemotaxis protein
MRILFIDDNEDMIECIGPCFKSEGHEVTTALGAQAGIREMKANQFDMIVCDREMPVFSGLHLCQLRNDLGLNTPFILFTGRPDLSQPDSFGNPGMTQKKLEELNILAIYDKYEVPKMLDDLSQLESRGLTG